LQLEDFILKFINTYFVLIVAILAISPKIILTFIYIYYGISIDERLPDGGFNFGDILVAIVIAPVFETLMCQSIFSWIDNFFRKNYQSSISVISAVFFSVLHFRYDFQSIFIIFWVGLVFQCFYFLSRDRGLNEFFIISVSHALFNGLSIFMQLMLAKKWIYFS
jgi:hypothetical protein